MNPSLFRTGILGILFMGGAYGVASLSVSACDSLSQTSPLPPADASDLDAGSVPDEVEEAGPGSSSSSSSSGDLPASGRVRLTNLLQGPTSVDLCSKVDAPGSTFDQNLITAPVSGTAKPDGLAFAQTSRHAFLSAAAGAGTKYIFKVVPAGGDCNDTGTPTYVTFASTALRQNSGLSLVAVGEIKDGLDAGDANPRSAILAETLAPPATASLFRVFHGVPDIAAFDVVINGETVLQSIKYATAVPYPYTSASGFATIAAGVPDDATLELRSGTTVRTFTIPSRLRRGIATSVFAGGTAANLDVELCSDREPDDGDVSTCTKLPAQSQ